MYFFRIKISSFDDEEKTLFIVPEQNADEKGVPFDEKLLTQTADYKQFVKNTATNMVDGEYTQFQTDAVFDTIDEQQFAQLEAEEKLTTVDSNTFSVSTGIKPAKKGGGTLDFKTIAIIAGIAVAGIVLVCPQWYFRRNINGYKREFGNGRMLHIGNKHDRTRNERNIINGKQFRDREQFGEFGIC